MNREIKFRAWANQGKYEMYYFKLGKVFSDDCREYINCDEDKVLKQCRLNDDDCFIMQYTGLKDKNGKEIYEGDIVKYKHIDFVDAYYEDDYKTSKGNEERIDTIEFKNGSFCPIPDISHPVDDEYNCTVDWDFEVIGNIYENPNLIK